METSAAARALVYHLWQCLLLCKQQMSRLAALLRTQTFLRRRADDIANRPQRLEELARQWSSGRFGGRPAQGHFEKEQHDFEVHARAVCCYNVAAHPVFTSCSADCELQSLAFIAAVVRYLLFSISVSSLQGVQLSVCAGVCGMVRGRGLAARGV